METQPKRRRGRPRKNTSILSTKSKIDKNENDDDSKNKNKKRNTENIILRMALSDDESNDTGDDNKFAPNDTDNRSKNMTIDSISDSDVDTEDNETHELENYGGTVGASASVMGTATDNQNNVNIKMLIEEIKKRDMVINSLKSKNPNSALSAYASSNKQSNINYHCVQLINSVGSVYVPQPTSIKCWWCDDTFTNLPAYIVNFYKDGKYYVFGNFCSFNCATKYNIKMLKDYKCNTRHALTISLRTKVTGDSTPIKLAADRELLKSKGGTCSIEKFRQGFSIISPNMRINMPPIIPLVHVIEEDHKD
jgi:hypothetical protein